MVGVVEDKPVPSAVSDDGQEAARTRLLEMLRGSRFVGPGPEPDDDELMRGVVDAIKKARLKRSDRRAFTNEELSLEDAAEIAEAGERPSRHDASRPVGGGPDRDFAG